MNFAPTRAAGLDHLERYAPRMGRFYAAHRNTDSGPGVEPTTSALSPYLRRRMILESEAVAAASALNKEGAEKFIQEVFWRSYFKGHLETRPALWTNYQALVTTGHAQLDRSSGLRKVYDEAITGRTGFECFDDWARELVAQNWLHNHTRMWFASIWIFTLGLPWALGAEFFMHHLIDGDPASNTLSWRWVAGLHTRGKAYAARAENIRRYTDGRYDPAGLNEDPVPLEEADAPSPQPLPKSAQAPAGDVALLLHNDDLHPESLDLGPARIVRIAGLPTPVDGRAPAVTDFEAAAQADALKRAAAHFGCPVIDASPGWAEGLPTITPWAPVGPVADALPPGVLRVRRRWDDAVWPKSTKGFFQVKAAIPGLLDRI